MPFTNLIRSYFFGEVSSKRDAEAYPNFLFHLYWLFRSKISMRSEWNAATNYQYSWLGKRCLLVMRELICLVLPHTWFSNVFFFAFLFNAGAGFDMLIEMLRYIWPAIVVQICITVQSKNLPDGVFWLDGGQAGTKMINIDAASDDASNRSWVTFFSVTNSETDIVPCICKIYM